jgi:hypothetical protein
MRTECVPVLKALLRSRRLGGLSLRLGCGEPLHGRLRLPATRRASSVASSRAAGSERAEA